MGEQRKNSNRLAGYDYSLPGAYFVTLVARGRNPLFGKLVGEQVQLNDFGNIIVEEWIRTAVLRPEITLDEFAVMPNHFHAILFIKEMFKEQKQTSAHRGAPLRRQPRSLGAIIAGFKSKASQRANLPLWQKNYYDRIIRNEDELNRIREYILYNPLSLSQISKDLFQP